MQKALHKFKHETYNAPEYVSYEYIKPVYGAKIQCIEEVVASEKLDKTGINLI